MKGKIEQMDSTEAKFIRIKVENIRDIKTGCVMEFDKKTEQAHMVTQISFKTDEMPTADIAKLLAVIQTGCPMHCMFTIDQAMFDFDVNPETGEVTATAKAE